MELKQLDSLEVLGMEDQVAAGAWVNHRAHGDATHVSHRDHRPVETAASELQGLPPSSPKAGKQPRNTLQSTPFPT